MPPPYISQPPLQLNWACVTSSNSLWVEVTYVISRLKYLIAGAQPSCFPGGAVVKNQPANARDTRDAGSIPGLGRSPGVGNGNPFQYSCLEKSMERGAWWATVHGVTQSQTHWACTHPHPIKLWRLNPIAQVKDLVLHNKWCQVQLLWLLCICHSCDQSPDPGLPTTCAFK